MEVHLDPRRQLLHRQVAGNVGDVEAARIGTEMPMQTEMCRDTQ